MMPSSDDLVRLFDRKIGEQAIVSAQDPLWLSNFSEPEPDIALLRYREDFFRHAHPRPGEVLLMVEVADAGLRYDREVKVPLYAGHGIHEVWIVDLEHRCIHVASHKRRCRINLLMKAYYELA